MVAAGDPVMRPVGWPRGDKVTPRDGLVEHLYEVAQHHAHAALALRVASDGFAMLDAVSHAGSAIEFVAKAAIANLDPILLTKSISKGDLLDSLNHLKGANVSPNARWRFTSLDASISVQMVNRIHPECRSHTIAAEECLGVRNDAIHMGVVDANARTRATDGMVDYVGAVVACLGRDVKDFWGAGSEDAVEVSRSRTERLNEVASLQVEAARSRYRFEVRELDPDEVERLVLMRISRRNVSADASFEEECPACGNETAHLLWNAEMEAEPDDEGGWHYYGDLVFRGLVCPVCELRLSGPEAESIGIDPAYPGDDAPEI